MAGIYIHIPFCAKACSYCNFHFSTSLKKKTEVLQAILKEMEMRPSDRVFDTIYLGGGTPSILKVDDLTLLFEKLHTQYDLSRVQEVTMEVNPEDATEDYLFHLKKLGVTRLSIGVQSFFDEDLLPMNRIHNGSQARAALALAKEADFTSLTVDLIYGVPWADADHFKRNLDQINEMGIPHLSAYALTLEEGTALAWQSRNNLIPPMDEDQAFKDFEYLQKWAEQSGFQHYEISNLCKVGHASRHNSNYWTGTPYLGLGPGAHSFDGTMRSWNIAHNIKYAQSIFSGILPMTHETLTEADQYNEWIMTGLRMDKGLDLKKLKVFSVDLQDYFHRETGKKLVGGFLEKTGNHLYLPKEKRFFADGLASDLFYIP